MTVETFAIEDARFAEFRRFAEELYAGDAHWSHPADPPAALAPVCMIVRDGDRVLARACLSHRPDGADDAATTMACGWYECVDDSDAAAVLLHAVRQYVRGAGFARVVGPLNGSTWHRYRFADRTDAPPFFLDVHNKPWYVEQWRAAGMEEIALYRSTIFDELTQYDRLEAIEAAHRDRGVVVRPLELDRIDDELRTIHALSVEGFRDNFLSSPISSDEFLALYRPIVPLVRPEHVLIAEDRDARPIGFVFAVDDVTDRMRRSLVMKSAAVLPEHRGIGLGHRLLESVHRTARDEGYDRIIHALMMEANRSAAILAERSSAYRTYRLFGCDA